MSELFMLPINTEQEWLGSGNPDEMSRVLATRDYDILYRSRDICDAIFGRSFCALGDGATSPIVSALKFFRDEFDEHVSGGGCPFPGSRVVAAAH